MATKLTRRLLDEAKPTVRPIEKRDAEIGGLLLRIQPSGVKTSYVELTRGVRIKLGRYPVMTLEAARKQAKARIGAFAKTGEVPARNRRADTLSAFIDDHYEPWVNAERKAGKSTVANLKAQFADFLDKPMTAISAFGLERFKADRLKKGIAPATVNRDLARLSGCLTKAIEWKMLARASGPRREASKGGRRAPGPVSQRCRREGAQEGAHCA